MNVMNIISRFVTSAVILGFAASGVSCMTTYDANGRPVQSVDPGAAAAGAVAAGALGYAIGQHNDNHNYYYGGGYYRPYYYGHYGYRRNPYGRRGYWQR